MNQRSPSLPVGTPARQENREDVDDSHQGHGVRRGPEPDAGTVLPPGGLVDGENRPGPASPGANEDEDAARNRSVP